MVQSSSGRAWRRFLKVCSSTKMKGRPSLYVALISLLGYTIRANIVESDFICEQEIVPIESVQSGIHNACWAFRDLTSRKKYPAVFDASTTFSIYDAILFAWPFKIDGDQYSKGHPGKFRLLIDSSCQFYGVILTVKDMPDIRCFQQGKPELLNDLPFTSAPRRQPVFRGYRCKTKIFDSLYLKNVLQENFHVYEAWKSRQMTMPMLVSSPVNDLFQEKVNIVPSEVISSPYHNIGNLRNPHFIVVNSQSKMIGMVTKSVNNWTKCDELLEIEPEVPYSVDTTKNSIGEFIFPGVTGYQCNVHKFTRKSVNSHMQLACNIMKLRTSSSVALNEYHDFGTFIPAVGSLPVFRQFLKLPEAEWQGKGSILASQAMIVFDKQCNFHGAFWYNNKNINKCNKLSP